VLVEKLARIEEGNVRKFLEDIVRTEYKSRLPCLGDFLKLLLYVWLSQQA
jgi:hypothetical protein